LTQIKPPERPLGQRLLWFAALWLAGVGTVALVSFALKLRIAPKRRLCDAIPPKFMAFRWPDFRIRPKLAINEN
jgi:hypothetical protein